MLAKGKWKNNRDDRAVLKHVETELKNYPKYKRYLKEWEENEYGTGTHYPTSDADMIRGSNTSDPTAHKALKLKPPEYYHRLSVINAIESFLEPLQGTEVYKLVELRYWKDMTPIRVIQELYMNSDKYCKSVHIVTKGIAQALGWFES